MAIMMDLPPEVINEIIFLVHLMNQELGIELPSPASTINGISYHLTEAQLACSLTYNELIEGSYVSGLAAQHHFPVYSSGRYLHYHRPRREYLLALSLTNRLFNTLVSPLLYRVVNLDVSQPFEGLVISPEIFLSTLTRHPNIADYVRSLSFNIAPIRASDLVIGKRFEAGIRGTTPMELASSITYNFPTGDPAHDKHEMATMSPETLSSWIAHSGSLTMRDLASILFILDRLSNLTTLKLLIEDGSHPMHSTHYLSTLFSSRSFRNVRELSLTYELPIEYLSLSIISHPLIPGPLLQVESLHISNLYGSIKAGVNPGLEDSGGILFRKSPIRNLVLEEPHMGTADLCTLLTFPKGLEHFSFSYPEDGNENNCDIEPGNIVKSLSIHRNTLRSVIIRGIQTSRLLEDPPVPIGSSLRDFSALQELGIPLVFRSDDSPISLKGNMPRKLKILRIYVCELRETTTMLWRRSLLELVQDRDRTCPELQEIWTEWTYEPQYPGMYATPVVGDSDSYRSILGAFG